MMISLTEMSGLIAKEKSLGNFSDRIAVDQISNGAFSNSPIEDIMS